MCEGVPKKDGSGKGVGQLEKGGDGIHEREKERIKKVNPPLYPKLYVEVSRLHCSSFFCQFFESPPYLVPNKDCYTTHRTPPA